MFFFVCRLFVVPSELYRRSFRRKWKVKHLRASRVPSKVVVWMKMRINIINPSRKRDRIKIITLLFERCFFNIIEKPLVLSNFPDVFFPKHASKNPKTSEKNPPSENDSPPPNPAKKIPRKASQRQSLGAIYVKASCLFLVPVPSVCGIFAYIWFIFLVNVGKCTSPMDAMGYNLSSNFGKELEVLIL